MTSRFTRSFVAIAIALFFLGTIAVLHPPSRALVDPFTGELFSDGKDARVGILPYPPSNSAPGVAAGGVIMSKLGNETAKAELGRATWRLLHTMTLRYPENPTQDERDALEAYMYLTSRLYPCGECAAEFQALLKKFPPQTASRLSASLWLCSVHNEVNVRLGKPEFDCSKLDETYDCGCGDASPASTSSSAHIGQTPGAEGLGALALVDLEDESKDELTGMRMIKGGR